MTVADSTVTIRPMIASEFDEWREEIVGSYAEQAANTLGGRSGDYYEEAERQTFAELPDGLDSIGQEIYVIEVHGEVAGSLWLRVDADRGRAFIVSLDVNSSFRLSGIGRNALEWIEDSLKARQVRSVGAHLFGVNRSLVDRLALEGYDCTEYVVEKRL